MKVEDLWLPTMKAARVLGLNAKALRKLRDRVGGYLVENFHYRYCWRNADGLEWNLKRCRVGIERFKGLLPSQQAELVAKLQKRQQAERKEQLAQLRIQRLINPRKRPSIQEMHEQYLERLRLNSGIHATHQLDEQTTDRAASN